MNNSEKLKPLKITLKLRRGDIIQGDCILISLLFQTPYGDLTIPFENLSQIDLGLVPSVETKQKVNNFFNIIQDSSADICKEVFDEMCKLDITAIPEIAKYISKDECLYPEYRFEAVLEFLCSKFDIKDYQDHDLIHLNYIYKFPGIADLHSIEINTHYGILSVPRNDIFSMEIHKPSNDVDSIKNFKLEPNKFVTGAGDSGWLNTGIKLGKGQLFSIQSEGEIKLASLNNDIHKPSGSYLTANGNWTEGNDSIPNASPMFGNVVFKIGNNDNTFKVAGSYYKGNAYSSGTLFLSIYETLFNPSNSGYYDVTVQLY
jgi:hypothetical protein